MFMVFKIAWRNIGRNKRRTAITAASIFFAVLFSVASESLNRGVFDGMIDSTVSFYVGYIQVLKKGYWEDRTLEESFEMDEKLTSVLNNVDGVDDVVPRLESFALASFGKITKSALVIGIDPQKEDALTGLAGRLIKGGTYLQKDDKEVMITSGLAEKLNISVNDTIILISQGYHGVNAANRYRVKGLISFGSPELNSKLIYLPLSAAQDFYGAENLITSLVLDVKDKNTSDLALQSLEKSIDYQTYDIIDWKDMMPEIIKMKEIKESSNKIVMFVLYLIIAFGVFGVILMMTKERKFEFGVLLSIGMSRVKLAFTIWLETVFLGFVGAIFGLVISYGLMYYLSVNPIVVTGDMAETYAKFGIEPLLPASVDLDIFITQALNVFVLTTLLAIYPCLAIWKMKAVDAMRA